MALEHLRFAGTPDDFRLEMQELAIRQGWLLSEPRLIGWFDRGNDWPRGGLFKVLLAQPPHVEYGVIVTVRPAPRGQSFLDVYVNDGDGPIQLWDRMRADLASLGYVERTSAGENASIGGNRPRKHPWEKIPDHSWDRLAVRLWHEGYTNTEIAEQVGLLAPRTVTNRLSKLRNVYTEKIVPRKEAIRRRQFVNENDTR